MLLAIHQTMMMNAITASLFYNVISLAVYVVFQTLVPNKWGLFIYNHLKYLYIFQIVVLNLSSDVVSDNCKLFVSYGFCFEYYMLHEGGRTPSWIEFVHRFIINTVHHITLIVPTTNMEMVVYNAAWLMHLFPWFMKFGMPQWIGTIGSIGNTAPLIAMIYYLTLFSLDKLEYEFMLSRLQFAVLFQMCVYRGVYTNIMFMNVSKYFGIPKDIELKLTTPAKLVTVIVSLVITVYFLPASIAKVLGLL